MIYDLYYAAGRKMIPNPAKYGEVVIRPVDRRELRKTLPRLTGWYTEDSERSGLHQQQDIPIPKVCSFNYFVQTTGSISDDMLREMGISKDDQVMFNIDQASEPALVAGLDGRTAQRTPFVRFIISLNQTNVPTHLRLTRSWFIK